MLPPGPATRRGERNRKGNPCRGVSHMRWVENSRKDRCKTIRSNGKNWGGRRRPDSQERRRENRPRSRRGSKSIASETIGKALKSRKGLKRKGGKGPK